MSQNQENKQELQKEIQEKKEQKEIKEIKEEKKPRNPNDKDKKRKSRNSFTLHTYALMYLLLKKGWTIKLSKTKTSRVTMQNYKCVDLSRQMMFLEERMNEVELKDLSNQFEELIKGKEASDQKTITLDPTDLLPLENSSETVSEE